MCLNIWNPIQNYLNTCDFFLEIHDTFWEKKLSCTFFQYFTFLISLLFHYPMKILSWTKGVQVWNQEQPLYLPTSYLVWSLWESFRTCLLSMVDFPRSEKVLLISMENFLNHFQTLPYWTIPNWKVSSTYIVLNLYNC